MLRATTAIVALLFAVHAVVTAQVATIGARSLSQTSYGYDLVPYSVASPHDSSRFREPAGSFASFVPAVDSSGAAVVRSWNGIGWFRTSFRLDASALSTPLSLYLTHVGAADIYLDGARIASFGALSAGGKAGQDFASGQELIPLDPWLDRSDTGRVHVLALRLRFADGMLSGDGGPLPVRWFAASTASLARRHVESQQVWDIMFLLPFGAIIALGLLHLLIYLFDRRQGEHLLYSVFALVFSAIFTGWHLQKTTTDGSTFIMLTTVVAVAWSLIIYVAFLLSARILFGAISRSRFIVGTAFQVVILVLQIVEGDVIATLAWGVFVVIAVVDLGRLTVMAVWRRQPGAWIIGTGLLVFSSYVLLWLLGSYFSVIELPVRAWPVVMMVGLVSMPVSMSIFLAYGMTTTARHLREQLQRVDELTAENLAQERRALMEEMRRHQVERDNARKTRELDEARKLQMSMLPATMPSVGPYDIDMAMHTASEVGGDYFDVYEHDDARLTLAIGDATGHGLKAGVMVATAKSHFQTHARHGSHEDILRLTSEGIRHVRLRGLYMCLGLLTLDGLRATWTAAGIPPVLHFVAATGRVDELLVKGLPLGSPISPPSTSVSVDVAPGDVLVMMTDGLPELFDRHRQSLGIEAVEECLRTHAGGTAADIVAALVRLGDSWRSGYPYEDDVTVVVVKCRPE